MEPPSVDQQSPSSPPLRDGTGLPECLLFQDVLILAGGGAKGAYQFGCLKALKEFGVQFEAVVGTSVGALNASLWSTDSMIEGEKLWRELSFETTYARRFMPGSIPRWLRRLLGVPFVIGHIFWANLKRWPLPSRALEVFLDFIVAMVALWWLWAVVIYVAHAGNGFLAFGIASSIVLSSALLVRKRDRAQDWKLFLIGTLSGIFAIALPVAFLADRIGMTPINMVGGMCVLSIGAASKVSWKRWLFGISGTMIIALYLPAQYGLAHDRFGRGLLFSAPLAFIWSCVVVALLEIIAVSVDRRVSGALFFERKPLEGQVTTILRGKRWVAPTWVTTAERRRVWSPPFGWHAEGVVAGASSWCPSTEEKWIPHYHPIHKCEFTTAVQLCLASAALPFGFVGPVTIGGKDFHDGGVVDNVPAFPMITRARRLFVVMMDVAKDQNDETRALLEVLEKNGVSEKGWQKIVRLLDLAELDIPGEQCARYGDLPRPVMRPRNVDRFPEIIAFFPQKTLPTGAWGPLIGGTLNFYPKFAKACIAQGHEETTQKLAALVANGVMLQTVVRD